MTPFPDRVILHVDINNFYASVAVALNDSLRGRAVAVCGDPDMRHGIVLAKSETAKKLGIKTGDTVWAAKKKCPELIIIPPDFKKYIEYSRKVTEIYYQYSPQVESFGLDECWIDVTGCRKLFGTGEEIAEKIRNRVKNEVGLTVSIGVSFTKTFAKLGSDMKKPDAITIINRENFRVKVWQLPVSELLYAGKSTVKALNALRIFTIGDLAEYDKEALGRTLGKSAIKLCEFANGIDDDKVKDFLDTRIPESVGNGTTASEDVRNLRDATSVIFSLSEVIAFRLRRYSLVANMVGINLRNSDLDCISRQEKLKYPINNAYEIAQAAISLLKKNYDFDKMLPLRTITVTTGNLLSSEDFVQISLFDEDGERQAKLESSLDVIRQKYGFNSLKRGVTMGTVFACDNRDAEDDFVPFDHRTKGTIKPVDDDGSGDGDL